MGAYPVELNLEEGKFSIRLAALEDSDDIFEIIQEAYADTRSYLSRDPGALRETILELQDKINKNEPLIFVIEHNGKIIGTFRLKRKEEEIVLARFAINKQYRGKGLGKQMMKAIEQIARELGGKKLTLETYESVPYLGKFYENLGYQLYDVKLYNGENIQFYEKTL